jgi:ubiquitin C-terminal hydrolase
VDWALLFHPTSLVRLLYSLQIAFTKLQEATNTADTEGVSKMEAQEWLSKFITRGGVEHIYSIFLNTDMQSFLADSLPQQCLNMMLTFLLKFKPDVLQGSVTIDYLPFVKRLLDYVTQLVDMVVAAGASADPDFQQSYTKSVALCLSLAKRACNESLEVLKAVVQHPGWKDIVSGGLVRHANSGMRGFLKNHINALCKEFVEKYQVDPREIFVPQLLRCLETMDTKTLSSTCTDFFELLQDLLQDPPPQGVDQEKLLLRVANDIVRHPVLESRRGGACDMMLQGLLSLARMLVAQLPDSKRAVGKMLIPDLTQSLFAVPVAGTAHRAKAREHKTRQLAFRLLAELATECPKNRHDLMLLLLPNHRQTHSGGKRMGEWHFEAKGEEKSETGYVGLKNLSAICYMNSLLQQLYMIPELRAQLLQMDLLSEGIYKDSEEQTDGEVYQLQYVMACLQESEKQYHNPHQFCHSFKGTDGKPMNVNVQEDAGEFLLKLCDKVSEKLKKSPYEKVFEAVMGGVVSNELIGRNGCPHYREREELFFGVTLEVKNKATLAESLDAFIEGELLEGSNQFKCNECDKKVDTVKRACIKKLPNTLAFIFKRFELDYNTMQQTKLNNQVDFPLDLDMRPYTKEGVGLPKGADASACGVPEEHPPGYYQYRLRGVVVHQGSATHGHYYSYIQERGAGNDGPWFEFNDTVVRPFDASSIPDECFGGMETQGYGSSSMGGYGKSSSSLYERVRNAYIVLYDRVPAVPVVAKVPVPFPPMSPRPGMVRASLPPDLSDTMQKANLTYWHDRHVFDRDYFDLLWKLVAEGRSAGLSGEAATVTGQLATLTALNNIARAFDKSTLEQWLAVLPQLYRGNPPLCRWLLSYMQEGWAVAFLVQCPLLEVKTAVGSLVCEALAVVAAEERGGYPIRSTLGDDLAHGTATAEESGVMVCFLRSLQQLLAWGQIAVHWKNFDPYWSVLATCASLSPQEAQLMCALGFLPHLLHVLLADRSPGLSSDVKALSPAMCNQWGHRPDFKDMLKLLHRLVLVSEPMETPKTRPALLLSDTPFPLSLDDRRLMADKSFVPLLLAEALKAESKRTITRVVEILQHLCWESESMSQTVVSNASSNIEEFCFDQLGPTFQALRGLVSIPDRLQAQRVEWVLDSLLSCMDMQQKYWKITDACCDFLVSMALASAPCRDWLHQHADRLTWLLRWLVEHENPPSSFPNPRDRVVLCKPQRQGPFPSSHGHAGLPLHRKLQLLECMAEGRVCDETAAVTEDDEDEEDRALEVGDVLRVDSNSYGSSKWQLAKVMKVHGTKVEVQFDGTSEEQNSWYDRGDARLRKSTKDANR